MTRTLIDAVSIANWPHYGWDLAACYVNGSDTSDNYATARLYFPHAQLLGITTDGSLTVTEICDCETGDYTPEAAAAWAGHIITLGHRPTIYASRSTWPLVVAALNQIGIASTEVDWWASTLDGTMGPVFNLNGAIYTAVAVQYVTVPPGYDLTVVYDDTWHPAQPPAQPVEEAEHVAIAEIWAEKTLGQWIVWANGTRTHVPDPASGSALEAQPPLVYRTVPAELLNAVTVAP